MPLNCHPGVPQRAGRQGGGRGGGHERQGDHGQHGQEGRQEGGDGATGGGLHIGSLQLLSRMLTILSSFSKGHNSQHGHRSDAGRARCRGVLHLWIPQGHCPGSRLRRAGECIRTNQVPHHMGRQQNVGIL